MNRFIITTCLLALIGAGCTAEPEPTSSTLPLGDGHVSDEARSGYIYACNSHMNGQGAQRVGQWVNEEDGTWDPSLKPTVDGEVDWPSATFTIELEGDERVFTGNGLPDHTTGEFPIAVTDDAYQYDRNPNSIEEQSITFSVPSNPELADEPSCVTGTVGIALNGVPIFNGFDAAGRDAVAYEIQDACSGHPERTGQYHYHSISACADDEGLFGYALDGFGIFGTQENGETLTNEDLDECHGHTHTIEWNGEQVEMYHYHATAEFPYTVGCFRGSEVATF